MASSQLTFTITAVNELPSITAKVNEYHINFDHVSDQLNNDIFDGFPTIPELRAKQHDDNGQTTFLTERERTGASIIELQEDRVGNNQLKIAFDDSLTNARSSVGVIQLKELLDSHGNVTYQMEKVDFALTHAFHSGRGAGGVEVGATIGLGDMAAGTQFIFFQYVWGAKALEDTFGTNLNAQGQLEGLPNFRIWNVTENRLGRLTDQGIRDTMKIGGPDQRINLMLQYEDNGEWKNMPLNELVRPDPYYTMFHVLHFGVPKEFSQLNPDQNTHALEGFGQVNGQPSRDAWSIGFEDTGSDFDFYDNKFTITNLGETTTKTLVNSYILNDVTITDPDDTMMSQASIGLGGTQIGDGFYLELFTGEGGAFTIAGDNTTILDQNQQDTGVKIIGNGTNNISLQGNASSSIYGKKSFRIFA